MSYALVLHPEAAVNLAKVLSRGQVGIEAPEVMVETHLAGGLPSFTIVGLPQASVREARERVRAALQIAGFEFPARRITVNLAPADLPKQGGRFDLPIALGILAASNQIPASCLENREFYGELGLSGELRPIIGALPALIAGQKAERQLFLPHANGEEASLLSDAKLAFANSLLDVVAALQNQQSLLPQPSDKPISVPNPPCLSEVIGQEHAKRALIIAASGGHHLLMVGSPGTGKTLLANRLNGLLPPLSIEQALEVAAIHSVAGLGQHLENGLQRPFRSPHHSSSMASLVGGGTQPEPGEISLAHHGVLFLDELPEFSRPALESLREPLESKQVVIARAAAKLTFPCNFQLVAAMNPSPSGEVGSASRDTPEQIRRYLAKLSGPLLDRFDLSIDVPRLPEGMLSQPKTQTGPTTAEAQTWVANAQALALKRQGCLNHAIAGHDLGPEVGVDQPIQAYTEKAVIKLGLSVRAFHRLLRVARTIADLDNSPRVDKSHVAEALGYRAMDRLLKQLQIIQ